jgi:hypothetical protein
MIREIYEGDFRPADNIDLSEDYQEKRQAAYELGKLFMSKVTPGDRDEFEKMLEAHMEVLVAGMEESYVSGFCDGVKLIIEALGR